MFFLRKKSTFFRNFSRSQRGYEKSGYRASNQDQVTNSIIDLKYFIFVQKRSNANEYGANKPAKNRESQNPKGKQRNTKETKNTPATKTTNAETTKTEAPPKRQTDSATNQNEERPNSSQKVSIPTGRKN